MPQIFPSSITEFSAESLIKKHSSKSKAIYWLLLFMIVALGVSLFYVKVDVNVNSPGIITSKELATQIIAPVYGRIALIRLKENEFVRKGDTLLVVDTTDIVKRIGIINEKTQLLRNQNTDLLYLNRLTKNSRLKLYEVFTPLYRRELQKFISDLRFQKSEIAILRKNYLRQLTLYKKNVIPIAEFQQASFKYENAKLKYDKIFENQLAVWQKQLNQNQNQIFNLNGELANLQKELDKHFITAPISGYVQNLTGIKVGGNIYPNEKICVITPTTDLIVETYVSARDIGFIHPHQKVKFRVAAFDYNQWGMLKGVVSEIAKDVRLSQGNIPTFIVRCKLDNTILTYHNQKVRVRKGMTVNANFFLTQRTLAQLLYDKVTNWIDPNDMQHATAVVQPKR
ncbi:MAG: HlyD family type I secretion periplasmic adaptor subunit [bacterium]|nr:MAG: HlyD family type I secretion periplasmic adaptor subunit [bacterium]